MSLPTELSNALRRNLETFASGKLALAAQELSANYRATGLSRARTSLSPEFCAAYAATRMPATYAVVANVLAELQARMPDLHVQSATDLGAGPGTSGWALATQFDELASVSFIERERGFLELGQKLSRDCTSLALAQAKWLNHDLEGLNQLPESNLIIASYSLGELAPARRQILVALAAQAASGALIIIEAGTPRGYGVILEARAQLIGLGLRIVAPCPHQAACPMSGKDWCHFPERLEREDFHRHIKGVQLGYEDEKYSYLIATRQPFETYTARVVKKPLKRSGHIALDLCTGEGLRREVVGRSDKESMRRAKKTKWGDAK
jgi:ribosomal protein RSM22 (predicted rRNA methylase)